MASYLQPPQSVDDLMKYVHGFLGTSSDALAREENREREGRRVEDAGIYQAAGWINGQFPEPEVPKTWLEERRQDVYAGLFPGDSGNEAAGTTKRAQAASVDPETGLPREGNTTDREIVGVGVQKFLKGNPRVRGVFRGTGGATDLLAGTQGHGGSFPRWEVTFKDGFIADVTGGGAHGAALKELLQ